jgi:hypothetical protein
MLINQNEQPEMEKLAPVAIKKRACRKGISCGAIPKSHTSRKIKS